MLVLLKNIHEFEHVTIKLNIFVYDQKIILWSPGIHVAMFWDLLLWPIS